MRRASLVTALTVRCQLVLACSRDESPSDGASGSGGSSGSGSNTGGSSGEGTSGTGGKAMHPPVGACDDLPEPRTWEDVTPPGTSEKPAVNGTVGTAVIVDPFDPRTVWLGTGSENDEIWRSDDCGATWTQVNTGPGSVGDGMTFGGVGDGAQWSSASMFSGGVARRVVE